MTHSPLVPKYLMKSCLSLDDITADPGLLSPWLQSFLSESVLERLDPLARRGVAQLAAWAEQPPLSLDARRANQVVLTRPIARM
jgi:hypothetical protein